MGKKELKDIIKNAVYRYIADDELRADYAGKLMEEIKEKCEQVLHKFSVSVQLSDALRSCIVFSTLIMFALPRTWMKDL